MAIIYITPFHSIDPNIKLTCQPLKLVLRTRISGRAKRLVRFKTEHPAEPQPIYLFPFIINNLLCATKGPSVENSRVFYGFHE